MGRNAAAYGDDFYGWTQEQAGLLRAGKLSEVDAENLAEEIESMGRSEADRLRSCLRLILLHLLKWQEQPARRSRSWRNSIQRERDNAALVLEDNPSLTPKLPALFAKAYQLARREAARETDLPVERFSEDSPFTVEQTLDPAFPDDLEDGWRRGPRTPRV
ncbi:DUF29 domain-containing protein [Azospirillum argentinense]|uniref:DUF29 domain-containing protein n=1 Tax=Azospirillum argentinense TaxID=2970906 RepID=A0A2K1G299_9PROT|nr:DUF29 domain-containing protein [Azospirillum argentinense]KAA1057944.1 hypothetical protein FH063_000144 [Azospirillum argentinense]MBK3804228.1 DUF29 family protein [Azospirillum argentinense]PNQ98916.1 DUF29 domain-containing protein [Azospirillum argentinense]